MLFLLGQIILRYCLQKSEAIVKFVASLIESFKCLTGEAKVKLKTIPSALWTDGFVVVVGCG